MGTVVALRGWDDNRASAVVPPSHVSPQLLSGVSVFWTSIGEKGMSPPAIALLRDRIAIAPLIASYDRLIAG